jgi:MscS family membrane protein
MREKYSDIILFLSTYFDRTTFWGLMSEILLVLLVTLLLSLIASYLQSFLHVKFKKTLSIWDDAIVGSSRKPVQLIIWVVGFAACLDLVNAKYNLQLLKYVKPGRDLVILYAITWFAFGVIAQFEKHWYHVAQKDSAKVDKGTVDAIAKLLRIVALIIAALIAAEFVGVGISGIIALAGGSSLVIAFASKDLVANFFGALMIYLDKPFKIGDWIRIVSDKNIEGYVEKIGLRSTLIKTFEKRPLYVPNSYFASLPIENPSRMTHRKIFETIAIRHEDLPYASKITDAINKHLKQDKNFDPDLPCFAKVDTISQNGINLLLCAYTKTTELAPYYQVKQELLLKVVELIEKYHAKITQGASMLQLPDEFYNAQK